MKRITIEIPDSKYAKLTADAEKLIAVKSKMCRLAGVECPKYKAANIVKEAAEFGAVEYVSNYIENISSTLSKKINLLENHIDGEAEIIVREAASPIKRIVAALSCDNEQEAN